MDADLVKRLLAAPGKRVDLKKIDPGSTYGLEEGEWIEERTKALKKRLDDLQEMLFSSRKQAVLFLFQGMDCSGKDGVIKHVMSAFNPGGYSTYSFKTPTAVEAAHDFLWRAHKFIPGKGTISAFNRSYYEEVLITRVHKTVDDEEAQRRFRHINHFEEMLAESGVKLVKIFLHISKEFQLEKLRSRLVHPDKNWKFDKNDLVERKSWGKYRKSYEDVLRQCADVRAPWYVVPSDNRWFRDYAALNIAAHTLESLDLSYPKPDPELAAILREMEGK